MIKKRKVILRADAGKTIGFGHFVRSLALAGYLKDDFDCRFCTFNPSEYQPSGYQLEEISKVCKFIDIEADSYEEYDSKFIEILKGDEIVVLDNYYFTTTYQKLVKENCYKLVCVDDMHDRHFIADAVITGTHIEKNLFSLEPYTKFMNGICHSFLREPFLKAATKPKSPILKHIVLAVGGADPYGLTNKLIGVLIKLMPTVKLAVIAGDTVDVNEEYLSSININRRLSAEQIVELFNKSDLGIFPASTICIEALSCRLPIAAGWYVDNQKEFYQYGVRHGLFLPLGCFLDSLDLVEARMKKILNQETIHQPPYIDFQKGKQDLIELFKNF